MSFLTPTRRASASIPGEPSLIYDVLTDYDGHSEWLPGVSQSKMLAREGDLAIAELELSQPQKDRLVFECIHTRNRMVLWRTIEGKAPIAQVEWTIEGVGQGRSQVGLSVQGSLGGRLFGPYRHLFVPAPCLKALERQLGTFMPELALTDEKGERLLELVETEAGFVCWIRGKKYVLQEDTRQL
jgi:hypothetical protein